MGCSQYAIGKGRGLAAVTARILAAGGIAVALAGCYPQTTASTNPKYPADYRERHPILLKEGERTVEVFVGRNRGGLTPQQRADVLAFAHAWRRDATGGVVIEMPVGPSEIAANETVREIHSIFAASGIPQRGVRITRYRPAPGALASIRLNYSRMVAEAGPCGTWPDDIGPAGKNYLANTTYWNFGCASQRNLAAMVDNPSDLVQPRGEGPVYTARRSVTMDKYRKGEDMSGVYPQGYSPSYEKGKLSDIGK